MHTLSIDYGMLYRIPAAQYVRDKSFNKTASILLKTSRSEKIRVLNPSRLFIPIASGIPPYVDDPVSIRSLANFSFLSILFGEKLLSRLFHELMVYSLSKSLSANFQEISQDTWKVFSHQHTNWCNNENHWYWSGPLQSNSLTCL